ncbi:MAG: hypothetical protein ACI81L_002001 [Verrucomicrobiales bacterium]|jgi:hypothetical protein
MAPRTRLSNGIDNTKRTELSPSVHEQVHMPSPWKSSVDADPADLRADVVVVGSGATGQSVAKRLAASGVDVLMVEAGPATETHRKSQRLLQAAMPSVQGQYPDFGNHYLMNLGGSIGKPQMPMSSD